MFLPLALVFAAQIEITPQDDLWATLQALQAGDEVIVHAGDYDIPGFVDIVLPGSEALPIVIRAADGETAVIHGIPEQNTFNISGSWYTLRGLEIAGGSHGVRVGTSDHATFEDLDIHGTADVGISCNRPDNMYEAITIRHNHIHDTGMGGGPGEGMYLGCNDGACVMWDSLVEFNWVHDTANGEQGDGIEYKTGSYNTIIRHNVVYNTKYPGITLYGTQGKAQNLVEGNVVWNAMDNGIQTVGDVTVRNNIVLNSGASGIAAKASQGEQVVNLVMVHNTVIGAGDVCLRGNNFDVGDAITIANNAFYCEGGTAIKLPNGSGPAVFAANAVVGGVEGAPGGTFDGVSVAAAFTDAATMQIYPAASSPLIDAADPQYAPADDFNCLARTGTPDVGAYDVSTPDNPGWTIQGAFKDCDADDPDPGTTGDTDDTTTDDTGAGEGFSQTGTDGDDTNPGETSGPEPTSDPSNPSDPSDSDDTTPTGSADTSAGEGSGTATAATAPTGEPQEDDDSSGCGCTSTTTTSTAPLSLVVFALLPRRRPRV
jgi:MYXO-CTERM domain-containing protein